MLRHCLVALIVLTCASSWPAMAERIQNPIAVFNGLDKITGLTTSFEVKIDDVAVFGGLKIRPRVCYTRAITEQPKTTAFVEVSEVAVDSSERRIFSGWMFAESPGLNAVDHPVFDVWLTGCRDPDAPPPPVETAPRPEDESKGEEGQPED
jgi:hypothetical protein